jgi:myotubularin-related protein 6/7/8
MSILLKPSGLDWVLEKTQTQLGVSLLSTTITRSVPWMINIYVLTLLKFSPTYPALLAVPAAISDNVLKYAGQYRSRARIPVLSYLHPVNNCTITRSSQPMAGFRGNRSIQDEKLVGAIFSSTSSSRSNSLNGSTAAVADLESTKMPNEIDDIYRPNEKLESSAEISISSNESEASRKKKIIIYGAQQHNLIVDARPTVNAMAMQAVGLGSENMTHYKSATKAYLGIDNIHVMRDSLAKVVDALKDSDITPLPPNREVLNKSGWLKHITHLLEGADVIARRIALEHSHVLIHCSDGWDRTSQLSALAQLCLDPFYRTIEGFIILVEKDWLGFGHMFRHRAGHLNSEKWFAVYDDDNTSHSGGQSGKGFSSGGSGTKALENAFLTAKGFFQKDHQGPNGSKPVSNSAENDESGEVFNDTGVHQKETIINEHEATKVKETSPVFHQFLDATYQLLYQHPTRFEFNERFLRRLMYQMYSCQYGTFLYNNERERAEAHVADRTRSVWDYFLCRKEQFLNKEYLGHEIDERTLGRERLITPRIGEIRWWSEFFGCSDQEMNMARVAMERYSSGGIVATESSTTIRDNGNPASESDILANVQHATDEFAVLSVNGVKEPLGNSDVTDSSSRNLAMELQ